jgi:hypothetical protein
LGGGDLPGPVGTARDQLTAADEQQTRPAAPPTEMSLVASYPKPAQWTPAKERELIGKDTWFPHTLDFLEVAGRGSKAIASPEDFLLKIIETSGRIGRLNFFSHGVTGRIATSGEVDPAGKSVSLDTGWTSVIGSRRIADPYANLWGDDGDNSGAKITVGSRSFSLDDVRAKFAPDAELWLYICHSGGDPMLLQNIANTFRVTVRAFSKIVVYCAPANFPASRKHRLGLLVAGKKPLECCEAAVNDFHQLSSDRAARPRGP